MSRGLEGTRGVGRFPGDSQDGGVLLWRRTVTPLVRVCRSSPAAARHVPQSPPTEILAGYRATSRRYAADRQRLPRAMSAASDLFGHPSGVVPVPGHLLGHSVVLGDLRRPPLAEDCAD